MSANFLYKLNEKAVRLRKKSILEFIDPQRDAKILDLGCDNGSWSRRLGARANTKNLYGIDIVEPRLVQAQRNGLIVKKSDLNEKVPFPDSFFDVVHADQVIEHIGKLDNFLAEIHRVLKPGGYTIISTENASSWHNIGASILGWQIFSLTNISEKQLGIGNPLALLRGQKLKLSSWTHKTIFNYRGLYEMLSLYEFEDIKISGAGYHPLPPYFGKIDPRHSHYITLKGYKSN